MDIKLNENIGPLQALALACVIARKNLKLWAGAALAFFLPMRICQALIPDRFAVAMVRIAESWINAYQSGGDISAWADGLTEAAVSDAALAALITLGLLMLFGSLAAGAANYIAVSHITGKPAGLMEMFEKTAARAPLYLITMIIQYALYAVGCVFIIPLIWLFAAIPFTENVVAHSGKWGFSAIMESFRFTKGKWARTFVFMLIIAGQEMIISSLTPYSGVKALDAALAVLRHFVCFPLTIAVSVLYCARAGIGTGGRAEDAKASS